MEFNGEIRMNKIDTKGFLLKIFTPILIAILFSLYHFWLLFNNVFRILAFAPVAYVAYKKKNLYISICFHCLCNLFSTVSFILVVLV